MVKLQESPVTALVNEALKKAKNNPGKLTPVKVPDGHHHNATTSCIRRSCKRDGFKYITLSSASKKWVYFAVAKSYQPQCPPIDDPVWSTLASK